MPRAADYQRQARAGLRLLQKRLAKLAEEADKIGHARGSGTFHSDADSVQAVLDAGKPFSEPEQATGPERHMLRAGLGLLGHNLKAAAGTVSALERADLATEFREEAEYIEQHLMPRLEEQVPLRLESAAASG